MHVWILMRGEDFEGGSIRGVFKTESVGLVEAARIMEAYGKWHTTSDHEHGHAWHDDGCDWITLIRHEVERA